MLIVILSVLAVAAGAQRPSHKAQLFEGSKCVLALGRPGVCKPLGDCGWAKSELSEGRRPEVCSYRGRVAVVCCPEEAASPAAAASPSRPAAVGSATGASATQGGGRIARKKCEEYSELVYREEVSPALMHTVERVDQCASSSDPLIVGGVEAKAMEFPHMALLGYGERDGIEYQCGGTLISPDFVLTAAHCILRNDGERARWVLLGELNRLTEDDVTPEPQLLGIRETLTHPAYRPPEQYNDIALLRLESTADMNGNVRPACLHTETAVARKGATATGWGHTEWDGELSDQMRKVTLPLQPYDVCNSSYRDSVGPRLPRGIEDDTQLCAGDLKGGKDTCQGDSGGPLQIFTDEKPYYCMHHIVGVTSFGKFCGFQNAPAIYTRVSYFVPWIESVVWPGQ